MKSTYLLTAVAYSLQVQARQIPAAGVIARQWGGGGGWGGSGGETCEWTDHCLGDPCETEIDCDGDLICTRGRCANPRGNPTVGGPTVIRTTTVYVTAWPTASSAPTCEWTGHCAGDPCETENECDGDMICRSGRCGAPPTTIITSTRRVVTSTRRVTTSTRRATPPVVTTTHRVTVPPVTTTRSTVRPQPTTTRGPTTPSCGDNPLACIGVSCETDADCGFALIICKDGVCGL
ncbi:hypothetical protein N657DRAFT_650239 [Parathielavia appendiculata]|uniref:Uncharacterized protein n=1 Tax=Parathielavia appendiculata TaxID=2587402 RepID=A0AAN6YYZ9_9PEZI|nr:hypothetical protein N657DRAFT_650239 [Parathielavia appendiculata]